VVTVTGKPAVAATTEPAPLAAPGGSPSPSPSPASPGRLLLAGVLLPLAAIGVAAGTLAVHVPGGITGVAAVTAALVITWALVALATARSRERTPQWQLAAGTLIAAVAAAAGRVSASTVTAASLPTRHHHLAVVIAGIAGPALVAISVHLELSLPDGRLSAAGRPSPARRAVVIAGYAMAAIAAAALAGTATPVPAWAGILAWSLATACALPAARMRYASAAGRDRERLQWAAIGTVVAGTVALSIAVLYLLVGWPDPMPPAAEAAMAGVPLGLLAAGAAKLGQRAGRALVQVLAIAGFAATVAVIYLVVILGLGRPPTDRADQEILGLSMIAAAVAAASFAPARERLTDWANRQVFGARQAPDQVLRTFGSRMTRAISMDELLLQLAESLRKTMTLAAAEVYTGAGDVLERVASVPDASPGPRSVLVGERERPVVARAGVSGHAWAAVWLPAVLEGRPAGPIRVAPVSHAGDLLGLLVVQRPADGDQFSAEDDRVLTELARQVGLAVHNARLDTALATTLDELRKQADELRQSRARIVASANAERRKVERDLHDGAQQHLVALAVNLRLLRDILDEDPRLATEMLDQLADEVKATIQELRDLAHGIYPPLLADSGLSEALKAAGRRSTLPVTVTAMSIGRYSLEIESAIYFCCLEALQNAAKHAPGATVTIRIWEESGGLLFSVIDDGPGFEASVARQGHGYVNMADRLGAIGGTVRWDSQPGQGSRISGSVPLI
jgi:signal transduction histidine kinase